MVMTRPDNPPPLFRAAARQRDHDASLRAADASASAGDRQKAEAMGRIRAEYARFIRAFPPGHRFMTIDFVRRLYERQVDLGGVDTRVIGGLTRSLVDAGVVSVAGHGPTGSHQLGGRRYNSCTRPIYMVQSQDELSKLGWEARP